MNGLSLQGLADEIDNRVTKQSLSKYDQGQVIPDSTMRRLLSDALQMSPDYLHASTAVEIGDLEFRTLQDYPAMEKSWNRRGCEGGAEKTPRVGRNLRDRTYFSESC